MQNQRKSLRFSNQHKKTMHREVHGFLCILLLRILLRIQSRNSRSILFLAQSVKSKQHIANGYKGYQKDQDPLQYAHHTLCFQIYEEVRVNQRSCCAKDQDRCVKLQNSRLNHDESYINKWECNGEQRICPFAFSAFIEQEPGHCCPNFPHAI